MSQYLEMESEETERHGDNEDQEVIYQELLVKSGLAEDLDAKAASKAIAMVAIVCSCGSLKCYMIRRYGLPRPTFHVEIEPVFPQSSRDRKAEKMVGDTSGS